MAVSLGKLRKTTKPNSNHVWNGSKTIEGLVVYYKRRGFEASQLITSHYYLEREEDTQRE